MKFCRFSMCLGNLATIHSLWVRYTVKYTNVKNIVHNYHKILYAQNQLFSMKTAFLWHLLEVFASESWKKLTPYRVWKKTCPFQGLKINLNPLIGQKNIQSPPPLQIPLSHASIKWPFQ